jgi:periplasmic divalent cation tolerance protein
MGRDSVAVWVVVGTFPDRETARKVSECLVEERLVACVNLVGAVESIYRWAGRVERAGEILAVMKTTESSFGALRDRFVELHPYELPELVSWPVGEGLPGYLRWVVEETRR